LELSLEIVRVPPVAAAILFCDVIRHKAYCIGFKILKYYCYYFIFRTYIFRDFCAIANLNIPQVPELHRVANALAPCLFLTPIDCYWEGAILQEPDADVEPIDSPTCENLANGQNLTWENLDFDDVRACLSADPTTGYTPFIDGVCSYLHIHMYNAHNPFYCQKGVGSLELVGYRNKPCFSSECPPELKVVLIVNFI